MVKYVGNAQIIKTIAKLPKIGKPHPSRTTPAVVYSKVHYSERLTKENKKYFIEGVDCFNYLYAIKIQDF